jgi:hypothetical protein
MAPTDKQQAELERAYALEKLTVALHCLVTGSGDVRERVGDAFFACHTLRERNFPQELRADWRWIEREVTKHGPLVDFRGEVYVSSAANTMRRRRRTTVAKIAERFWKLYWAMSENRQYS